MNDRKSFLIGCAIGGVVLLCIGCFAAFGLGVYFVNEVASDPDAYGIDLDGLVEEDAAPTVTPELLRVEEDEAQPSTSPAQLDALEASLSVLAEELVPENNPRELAMRFLGLSDVPEFAPDLDAPHALGETQSFWIINTSTNDSSQVEAVLRYETDHAYFWIQDGVRYDEGEVQAIVETFENEIYPTTRAFFGSEWTPGVDNDPHIYILYTRGVGYGTAGYFSSSDSLHPLAHEYSNTHEMFVFNADNSPLNSKYTYGVLAHEFQHMIHWNGDRNETSWINEGFSEVAVMLNGYSPGGFDRLYLDNTDWQLNNWDPSGNTSANYGASFLFLAYFLDQYGEDLTRALVADQANGLASIDQVLAASGAAETADDVVLDWAITNQVLDSRVGDGRYDYLRYKNPARAQITEEITVCDGSDELRNVVPYGVDYIKFSCAGDYVLNFEGSQWVEIVPADAYSGDYFFWSNKGDESDMTMTRQFDFTDHSGDLTLSYQTWYDIEADYDYVYLLASTDGENWQILTTPSGTADDPSGNSYGWAYNGVSGDWIEESVDIGQFAGQQVYLRFEYVTDAAVHGEGLMLDDIRIAETGYFEDFEAGVGDWDGQGFVRIANGLPQSFRLAMIVDGSAGTEVNYLKLDANNRVSVDFQIGGGVSDVTLVVVGTTRYTRQPGTYQFSVVPK